MIRTIGHEGNRTEISIRYLDSTVQQYPDAFGWPIEPLEKRRLSPNRRVKPVRVDGGVRPAK